MALYDRLLGLAGDKIPAHQFQATLAEFARGRLTGAQAQAIISAASGSPLDAGEVTEAQALLATFTGSTAVKLQRAKEVDDVLLLAEAGLPGYDTVALVKTRLGL